MENLYINRLTQLTESRPLKKGLVSHYFWSKYCDCNDGSSEGRVWQSLHAPRVENATLLDTFDLVLRVVVTAPSVPEREAIAQVLSFSLPDGAKGFTAVYGQAISLSCYPLPLFIQPLRLGPNQPATARSHSLQPRSTFSPNYPIVKFCDNF